MSFIFLFVHTAVHFDDSFRFCTKQQNECSFKHCSLFSTAAVLSSTAFCNSILSVLNNGLFCLSILAVIERTYREAECCTETQRYIIAFCCVQVKPLLQVTNAEEKLNQKENELRQVTEHLTVLRGEHDSLKNEQQQLTNDKVLLTEQLRAEQDLSAETEEVQCLCYALQKSLLDFVFVSLNVEFFLSVCRLCWLVIRMAMLAPLLYYLALRCKQRLKKLLISSHCEMVALGMYQPYQPSTKILNFLTVICFNELILAKTC